MQNLVWVGGGVPTFSGGSSRVPYPTMAWGMGLWSDCLVLLGGGIGSSSPTPVDRRREKLKTLPSLVLRASSAKIRQWSKTTCPKPFFVVAEKI